MSAYIKISTLEYPRHIGDIWLDHPEFKGKQVDGKYTFPETYAIVEDVEFSSYDSSKQVIFETSPILKNGKWYKVWGVRDLTQEELDAIAQAEIEEQQDQE
jgi:hypothetical protein